MSGTLPILFLFLLVGYVLGRLTAPNRGEVDRYAEEIHRKGVDEGYEAGWQDGRANTRGLSQ